jgi:hypothetical protein
MGRGTKPIEQIGGLNGYAAAGACRWFRQPAFPIRRAGR